jgi:hypothetical protein
MFPLQILVTMIILQLAFLYVAGQVVHYAAFAAARAELVGESAEDAAEALCTPVSGIRDLNTGQPAVNYPGWGDLDRSEISRERTSVEILTPLSADAEFVEVKVTCNVELIFPVANKIVSWIPLGENEEYGEINGIPHVAVVCTKRIPVPWRKEAS